MERCCGRKGERGRAMAARVRNDEGGLKWRRGKVAVKVKGNADTEEGRGRKTKTGDHGINRVEHKLVQNSRRFRYDRTEPPWRLDISVVRQERDDRYAAAVSATSIDSASPYL